MPALVNVKENFMTLFQKNRERNLSMIMDFYELTMSNEYFQDGKKDVLTAFEIFYRQNPDHGGFAIFAGLEQIIEYLENLHFGKEDIAYLESMHLFTKEFLSYLSDFKFRGTIYSLPEGTVIYPNTPILTVIAPLIDTQLIETALLLEINHQSLIATKARRMVTAAKGKTIADFGARRAHNTDAAVYGARAAYIGGTSSTATVLAGQMFSIPVSGTMAHSYVMFYKDEYTAFKKYAKQYPDSCILLVDTYNVLKSGIPNAIRTAKEVLAPMGKRLKGVRLDSGDLAYLSKKVRKMLDQADLQDCQIIASNSLDEYTIASLINQKAAIDFFGVGERLITSKSDPVFGAVYKITAVEKNGIFDPRIKISENMEKTTNPGLKKLYRIYNQEGKAIADLLTAWDETPDMKQNYHYIDPSKSWETRYFKDCTAKPLQELIYKDGSMVYSPPDIHKIRSYVKQQLEQEIWEEEQRFEYPHNHYLAMSPKLYKLKQEMLAKLKLKPKS